MTSPVTSSLLTWSDLERSNSRSLRFWSLISCKRADLCHMVLLNINRKAYMGSPMTLSLLTLSDLERSNSRSLRFRSLISCKGEELGHKLLLNINRKAYMESPIKSPHMTLNDLVRSKLGPLRFRSLISCKELSRLYVTMKYVCRKLPFVTSHTNCRCQVGRQGPWTSCSIYYNR